MGEEDKPKNPLDEFWERLGDKDKKYVRSYRPNKRHIPTEKEHADSDGRSSTSSSKRRD
tara:strand:+ start:98 stop:274 length:177 start_codon:yes stop_codon:yes gene_type:complete